MDLGYVISITCFAIFVALVDNIMHFVEPLCIKVDFYCTIEFSLLYVIYGNEIPLLHKLVGTHIMPFLTKIKSLLIILIFHMLILIEKLPCECVGGYEHD